MNKNSKILIVGHLDAIENSLVRYFHSNNFLNVFSSSAHKIDLLNQNAVEDFFIDQSPDYVFFGSVRSGGISANQKFAAEFIYENLQAQTNVIHSAYRNKVKKLLYYTGSCAYPKNCPQPIKEEYLLTGELEKTSEPYSIAKIAGTKLCETYNLQYGFNAIVGVPATIYGPESDMELETAHVMGALIGKFLGALQTNASEVTVWGSGNARREFLFKDDFIDASLFLMENYSDPALINIGTGMDISIRELAQLIKDISGFKGNIVFDLSKPEGTPVKLMDSNRINKLGWKSKVGLEEGIRRTIEWYTAEEKS